MTSCDPVPSFTVMGDNLLPNLMSPRDSSDMLHAIALMFRTFNENGSCRERNTERVERGLSDCSRNVSFCMW